MKRKHVPLLIVPLLLALVAACGGSDSAASSVPDSDGVSAESLATLLAGPNGESGISVSGLGVAVAAPDIASLSLGVSTLANTARQARDDAANDMDDLIDSLQDNGIAEEDYHTSRFSIEPDIDRRPNGEEVIRGYRVDSTLAVTVRDLDRVGEVIDDAVDAVGDSIRVQGVAFGLDDASALQGEARAQAMAAAKAKAEDLAELADVDLGKPITISESSSGARPPVMFFASVGSADASTPISPGQLETTITVTITYAIQ
jgi:uncharacterized protein YggE